MAEVSLIIEDQTFTVKKNILCEYSDYFRAMFCGSYVENDQKEITIDMVDATSMNVILGFMEMGMIDLFEFSLPAIGELAMAVNFLQITELIKQIQYTLETKLSLSNWIEIMTIAENACYNKLEQTAATVSLHAFKSMKPGCIPNIHKLFWYLSHPYLDTDSELEVFKFGLQWISHTETGADALMIIIGCLDMQRITLPELVEIKKLVKDYVNSLAAKVIDCLHELLAGRYELNTEVITEQKQMLCEMFTERVYCEVQNLVKESKSRIYNFALTLPLWELNEGKPELGPHYLYTFSQEGGFEKWLQVADKHLWGWCVTNWGPMKLVVVCGELGRGTGIFMREVKVYDVLTKEWIHHGVQLPLRRHGGVVVVGDMLYIVGGVGGFRVVLDTVLLYNLKQRTFRKIARLPDAIQSPAVCVHEHKVYAAGHNNIYRYEDFGETDTWVRVIGTDIRMSCMMSFRGYIYCTQNYFSYLYRFQPGNHKKMEMISCFTNPAAGICHLGNRLLFITRTMCGHSDSLSVEEFKKYEEKPKVVWSQTDVKLKVNEVAGSCRVAMSMPPLHRDREVSQYHRRYLMRYSI